MNEVKATIGGGEPARLLPFIYLNNAAEGWPKATGVAQAVARALEDPPACTGRTAGLEDSPAADCRRRIAHLLEVPDPRRIVLTTGATHALNLAIRGLALHSEAAVVTSVTEHNSVLRPLFLLEREGLVRTTVIGLDTDGRLDTTAFERALCARPKLVALTHAPNVTGAIHCVEQLFAKAKESGAVTLLDASQTEGHLPVLPLQLGADLVAFPGHKGLHGPTGTGALYVGPQMDLDPIIVGGTGFHSQSRSHPVKMPERLEAGTPNLPGLAGLSAALAWHEEKGEGFRRRASDAGRWLREELRSINNVRIFGDGPEDERLGVISFQVKGWHVNEVGLAFRESFGIACRTGLHCAPLIHEALGSKSEGTVRLSVSGFTTKEQVEAAVAAAASLAN